MKREEILRHIDILQTAIKQIDRDLDKIREGITRDRKDQWRIISELTRKLEAQDE